VVADARHNADQLGRLQELLQRGGLCQVARPGESLVAKYATRDQEDGRSHEYRQVQHY